MKVDRGDLSLILFGAAFLLMVLAIGLAVKHENSKPCVLGRLTGEKVCKIVPDGAFSGLPVDCRLDFVCLKRGE